jgi:ubiquinone/menaquinone biosynthesis C-methylase UbiE
MQNRYSDLVQRAAPTADSGLTAFGWEQTSQLAQWLTTHESIDVLYSASLLQSRLTAQRLGQTLGLSVTVNERIPGRFPPDLALPAMWDRNARTIEHFEPLSPIPPDSPYGIYLYSLIEEIEAITQANWGKTIALILSGNGVATAVRHFAGAHALSITVSHTAITELRRQDGLWSLVYANRREHLPVGQAPVQRQRTATIEPNSGGEITKDIAQVLTTYARIPPRSDEQINARRIQRMQHLLRFAQLPKDLCILDIGTGTGQLALLLAEDGAREVVGIDISPAMLEAAELTRLSSLSPTAARVNFRLAPAHALPFRDERFDAIICRLVLHHSHKPQIILTELARLLKHGGVLIVADLLSADDPVKRATQNAIEEKRNPSHVAIFNADQYRKLITGLGLVIDGEQIVSFERELEEWLDDMQTEPGARTVVREMIEAGLETDAAGLHARRQSSKLVFDQRMFYVKAVKP